MRKKKSITKSERGHRKSIAGNLLSSTEPQKTSELSLRFEDSMSSLRDQFWHRFDHAFEIGHSFRGFGS
jgi:hypothetical protein